MFMVTQLGLILRDARDCALLRMRLKTPMVRRRANAVSNHEAIRPAGYPAHVFTAESESP